MIGVITSNLTKAYSVLYLSMECCSDCFSIWQFSGDFSSKRAKQNGHTTDGDIYVWRWLVPPSGRSRHLKAKRRKKADGLVVLFGVCVCGERSASSLSSGHTQITTEADTRIVWSPFCVCVCFVGQSQTTGGTLLPIPTRIHCCPSSPNGTIQWRRAWGWRVNQTLFFLSWSCGCGVRAARDRYHNTTKMLKRLFRLASCDVRAALPPGWPSNKILDRLPLPTARPVIYPTPEYTRPEFTAAICRYWHAFYDGVINWRYVCLAQFGALQVHFLGSALNEKWT